MNNTKMPLNKVNDYDKKKMLKTDLRKMEIARTYFVRILYSRWPINFVLFFIIFFCFAFLWRNNFIWYCCFVRMKLRWLRRYKRKRNKSNSCLAPYAKENSKSEKVLAVFGMPLCTNTRIGGQLSDFNINVRYVYKNACRAEPFHTW